MSTLVCSSASSVSLGLRPDAIKYAVYKDSNSTRSDGYIGWVSWLARGCENKRGAVLTTILALWRYGESAFSDDQDDANQQWQNYLKTLSDT